MYPNQPPPNQPGAYYPPPPPQPPKKKKVPKWIIIVGVLSIFVCGICSCVGATNTKNTPQTTAAVQDTATLAGDTPTDVATQEPTAVPTEQPTQPPVVPTDTPAPAPTQPPAPVYNFDPNGGHLIYNPPADFCDSYNCITSFWNGRGYVIQCTDGMYSKSGGIRGSCSRHGGDRQPLYQH